MAQKPRVLTTDRYGHPCITHANDSGQLRIVFEHNPWYRKLKGMNPMQGLARDVIITILTDPSFGTIAQVFDSLQPSPKVDEFKAHLLREARWAQRILNAGIKRLDPESKS